MEMEMGKFYTIRNSVVSLTNSTDLIIKSKPLEIILKGRNSIHVSHRSIAFKEVNNWALTDGLVFENTKRRLTVRKEYYDISREDSTAYHYIPDMIVSDLLEVWYSIGGSFIRKSFYYVCAEKLFSSFSKDETMSIYDEEK